VFCPKANNLKLFLMEHFKEIVVLTNHSKSTHYSHTLSYSLNVNIQGHMTSILLSILERDPPLLLS